MSFIGLSHEFVRRAKNRSWVAELPANPLDLWAGSHDQIATGLTCQVANDARLEVDGSPHPLMLLSIAPTGHPAILVQLTLPIEPRAAVT